MRAANRHRFRCGGAARRRGARVSRANPARKAKTLDVIGAMTHSATAGDARRQRLRWALIQILSALTGAEARSGDGRVRARPVAAARSPRPVVSVATCESAAAARRRWSIHPLRARRDGGAAPEILSRGLRPPSLPLRRRPSSPTARGADGLDQAGERAVDVARAPPGVRCGGHRSLFSGRLAEQQPRSHRHVRRWISASRSSAARSRPAVLAEDDRRSAAARGRARAHSAA